VEARVRNQSFVRRHLRTILAVAVAALAIHDVLGPHGFLAMHRTQQEIDQISAQMQQLDKENESLKNEITALKTDPQLIERIAREDIGLARPGEMIFKMPAAPDDPTKSDLSKSR
jgi:cell division protein FtsB